MFWRFLVCLKVMSTFLTAVDRLIFIRQNNEPSVPNPEEHLYCKINKDSQFMTREVLASNYYQLQALFDVLYPGLVPQINVTNSC